MTVRGERRRSAARRARRRAARAAAASPTSRARSPAGCRAASASASRSRARWRATPSVLLLDEPLSALDAHTRARVRERARRPARRARDPDADRHPRLPRRRARSPTAIGVDPRRPPAPARHAGRAARPARPTRSSPASPAATCCRDRHAARRRRRVGDARRRDHRALAEERASGRVGVAVHPWDVEPALAVPDRDGRNAVRRRGRRDDAARRARPRPHRPADRRASAPDELHRGAQAFALFHPRDVRLVPLDVPSPATDQEEPG